MDGPGREPHPQRPRRPRLRALALVGALLMLAGSLGASPATAHCDPGTDNQLFGIVSTCPYNDDVEAVVDALNDASDDTMVYVLVKDMRFHPEVIDLRTGGTVVFVYADSDNPQPHDPKSSGSTGDPAQDIAGPTPTAPGTCFSVTAPSDNDAQMTGLGDVYPLTFTFDGQTVHKSRGVQSGQPLGDVTGAQPWYACPAGSFSIEEGGAAIVPYHCGVHGGPTTSERDMRGAIRIHGV